jgi:lysophospholipase L1-like esterase
MRAVLLLALVAGLAGLAAVELAARVLARRGCVDEMPGISARNPFYGWGHAPGASGWAQRCLHGKPEWGAHVAINSRGLRDREIPYARTHAGRILLLGDSFAAGLQVDLDHVVAKRIERTLNAPDPPGAHVEIVNAGVSGWGTDNELLFFLHEGWRYRPDVVLLFFNTGNDAFENHRPLVTSTATYPDKPFFRLVDGRLVREHYPLPPAPWLQAAAVGAYRALWPYSAFVRRLGTVSFVWRYLQAPPAAAPGLRPAKAGEVCLREYPPEWREAWRITRGLLLRLHRAVEARGARLVVVVLNGREEVSPQRMDLMRAFNPELATADLDPDKPNRLIARFLARRGIPTIPLLDAFRARFGRDGSPGFHAWDIHWTAAGHALAAEIVARRLDELGVVPLRRRAEADGPSMRGPRPLAFLLPSL